MKNLILAKPKKFSDFSGFYNSRNLSILVKPKKSNLMHDVIIQIIIVGVVFALFFGASASRANSMAVKQQVVEKQIALLIESASPGMDFTIYEKNMKGVISKFEIKENRVFAYIDSQTVSKGYPFFTKYSVALEKIEGGYKIKINGN